jgi:predicted phage terminase large subunit-like protein
MSVSRTDESAVLEALLRTDLRYFVWKCFQTVLPGRRYDRNWHIDAMIYKLLQVRDGEITRLLINLPPRSLKSICTSVAYVAWLLGHDPARHIIVASYSNELAAELHRQFRMVVDAAWYRALFPAMRPAKDTGTELVTTAGGSRYATSVGGTLAGRGADLIVVDDPLKFEEAMSEVARKRVVDWFQGDLITRLNDKGQGAIVVIMPRLHEDDLAGQLLRQGKWCHLDFPAIAVEDSEIPITREKVFSRRCGDVLHPTRESREVLDGLREEMGSLKFSAEYQQRPVPQEGNFIQRRWFRFVDRPPEQRPGDRIVQSWDVAMVTGERNDYSVCTTWLMVGSDYYLIDVFRGRLTYPDLRRKVAALAERYAAQAILIEHAGPGTSLLQDLRRDLPPGMPYPIGQKPEGSKRDRMEAQSARIEAGHMHVLKEAAWLDTFLLEILAFPRGRHDDQVDSVSQFLNWAAKQRVSDTQNCVIGFPYTGQKLVTNCSTLADDEGADAADAAAHQIIGIY